MSNPSTTTAATTAQHWPRFARLGRLDFMAERLPEWHRPSAMRSAVATFSSGSALGISPSRSSRPPDRAERNRP